MGATVLCNSSYFRLLNFLLLSYDGTMLFLFIFRKFEEKNEAKNVSGDNRSHFFVSVSNPSRKFEKGIIEHTITYA